MKTFDELSAFKAIVEHEGISAAARALNLPKSSLARRVNELEKRLGSPLFIRDTRSFVLTSFGRECYGQARRAVRETEKLFELAESVASTPIGDLYVICPPFLGTMLIEKLAGEFAIEAPGVRLHLEESSAILDPRKVSADLIIYGTFGPLPDLDVVARRIVESDYVLAVKRQIAESAGPIADPDDLARLDCLGFGPKARKWSWNLRRGTEKREVVFTPRFTTTHLSALIEAVRLGLGVAAVPVVPVRGDIASGDLVHVLPDWSPPKVSIYAIYPNRRSLSAASARFLDMIIAKVPEILAV